MNIYEKIINTTIDLQKTKITKSGNNKYTGFKYFELKDIAPPINKLCSKYKILINIKYDEQKATMDLIDAEKPEDKVTYTSPMGSINLKGAHDIQNLGAIQTYLRRYLFLTAFNIIENDELDCMEGNQEYERKRITKEILNLYIKHFESDNEKIKKLSQKLQGESLDQLENRKNNLLSTINQQIKKS